MQTSHRGSVKLWYTTLKTMTNKILLVWVVISGPTLSILSYVRNYILHLKAVVYLMHLTRGSATLSAIPNKLLWSEYDLLTYLLTSQQVCTTADLLTPCHNVLCSCFIQLWVWFQTELTMWRRGSRWGPVWERPLLCTCMCCIYCGEHVTADQGDLHHLVEKTFKWHTEQWLPTMLCATFFDLVVTVTDFNG